MKNIELLAEAEDVLRTMPSRSTLRHPTDENFAWLGRVSAFITLWNSSKKLTLDLAINNFNSRFSRTSEGGFRAILILLHEAQQDLRLSTSGPANLAVEHGKVFDYFDQIRKIIESAKQDILFIDPYLNADFVSRYLSHVTADTTVRLLARQYIAELVPSVEAFSKQSGLTIHIRSATNFHDRHLIVDQTECYQSGASFKEGADKAATTITQLVDTFPVILKTYEDLWKNAKVVR